MGTYQDASLADTRKRRDETRQKIGAGTDPGAQRRLTEGAPERTFEAVAQHYLAGLEVVSNSNPPRRHVFEERNQLPIAVHYASHTRTIERPGYPQLTII